MLTDVKNRIDEYLSWIKDKTALRDMGSHVEITTPYLDRHNDYIQIYVREEDGRYMISDGGYTISDLSISGCEIDTPKRKNILHQTLVGMGVENREGSLLVEARKEDFSVKKHDLIQAILAVNDLFYLSKQHIESIFHEDVEFWLEKNEIRFSSDVRFRGNSGVEHHYDFVIPKSKELPERLIKVINNPAKQIAMQMAFSYEDTRKARKNLTEGFVVINDKQRKIPANVHDILKSCDITPIPWSDRRMILPRLVA